MIRYKSRPDDLSIDQVLLAELREIRAQLRWQTVLLGAVAALLGARVIVPGA